MMNEDLNEIVFLTVIAARKQKDPLLVALWEAGGRLVNIVYGKGFVRGNYLRDMFGFVPDEHKVVFICLMQRKNTDAMLKMLVDKFQFDKPNTGIAFTIPIDQLSF